jgi:hypothetical protein
VSIRRRYLRSREAHNLAGAYQTSPAANGSNQVGGLLQNTSLQLVGVERFWMSEAFQCFSGPLIIRHTGKIRLYIYILLFLPPLVLTTILRLFHLNTEQSSKSPLQDPDILLNRILNQVSVGFQNSPKMPNQDIKEVIQGKPVSFTIKTGGGKWKCQMFSDRAA